MTRADELSNCLKLSRRYLKSDYKVHLDREERWGDHCTVYALSDQDNPAFSSGCNHDHDLGCDRCQFLNDTLAVIETQIDNMAKSKLLTEEQSLQFRFLCRQAIDNIRTWKAHLARSSLQEVAKHDAFKTFDTRTVIIIMDWAMKLLPMYFRERMTDFFGKRGRSWHVSAVVMKVNDELSVECFVHVFDNCTQNWFAVASILEHVLTTIKSEDARLHKARIRSDNAGCWHNASIILSLKALGERTGIHVERYDFSETQSGKDICDRKIATMKQYIRRYVNEKNDVLTASDVKKALESHGGVRGCRMAVAQINTAQADDSDPKWPGISFLYSFPFNKSGMRAWRAYDVGKGHHSPYHELPCVQPEATGITIVHGFSRPSHPIGSMVETGPASRSGGKIFGCNDPNCVLTFDSEQNQQHHIDVGDHQKVVENESAYD